MAKGPDICILTFLDFQKFDILMIFAYMICHGI